jgi:hypothetical protein
VKIIILAAFALTQAFSQTQLDLGRQAKNVDFSGLPFVRPFRTGAALPGSCLTGEMFFLTNAIAGSNSYGCVAPNSWSLEGSAAVTPLQVSWSTSTILQIGSVCSVTVPCNVRLGGVVFSFVAPASVTVQSGSGLALLYVDGTGSLTVGTSSATTPQVTCSGCQTVNPITQFPVDSVPLATWNATSGNWDATGTDERTILSGGRTFTAGPNIQLTESGDNVTITAVITNSQTSGGGSTNPYNPLDMTEFDRTIVFAEYGYSSPAPFGNSGGCVGIGTRAGVAGEVTGPNWLGSGNPCVLYYPPAQGGAHPFVDFLSGSDPLAYTLSARFAGGTGSTPGPGNLYVGWSSASDGTVNDFVGLRYLASGNVWQCVITSGGTDLAATTMASIPDTAFHTFVVANGTTSNTVTCGIDGSSQTSSATIPPSSWYSVVGTNGTPLTYFTAIEERIEILGISR